MDHEMRILMRGNEYRVPAAYQDLHGYFELYVSSSGISTMPPLRPADIPDPGPRPSEPVAPVPAVRPDEPPRPSTTDEPEVRIRIRNAHRAWEDACDEEDFREHAALRRYEEDLVQFQEWDRRQEEFAQHERNMAAYEEEREAWWAEFRSWDEARKEAEREPRKSPAARKRVLDEDREEGPSVKRAKRGKGKEREKSPDGRTDRFGSHREYPFRFQSQALTGGPQVAKGASRQASRLASGTAPRTGHVWRVSPASGDAPCSPRTWTWRSLTRGSPVGSISSG